FTVMTIFLVNDAFADRLDQMISPVTNPVNFEDPRINSEFRFIFVHHEFDDDFVTAGGDLQLYALQLRYAINEDLAFIATKDGYIDFNPEALPDDSGWANIEPGFKYSFYKDAEAGNIASAILRYELPLGDSEVFQGEGDGVIHPSVSAAFALGEQTNFMAASGLRIPVNSDDSMLWDVDVHVDHQISLGGDMSLYPLLEVNMVHVADAGKRLPIADEGGDVINFGSTEADGKTLVTGALGARLRTGDSVDLGVAYQVPLTSGAGSNLFDWRLTADVIVSF
ncbi:MAG: hypothetical protein KDD56_06675, partial [Bdellovibrionales bacterium]|nr:hypothetical protein [Bdellovibrionales bacterium]